MECIRCGNWSNKFIIDFISNFLLHRQTVCSGAEKGGRGSRRMVSDVEYIGYQVIYWNKINKYYFHRHNRHKRKIENNILNSLRAE